MATTKNLSDLSKAHLISQNPFFSASAHPGSSIFMNTSVNPFGLPGMNGLPMGFLANPNYFTSHDQKLNNDSMYSSFNPLRDDSLSHLQSISDHDKSSDEKDIDVSVHSRDSEDEEDKGSGYRNQKKPIPNEQKDGKYFERRRRNNLAAKKSRDARKTREDQLATRVAHLEKENAIFRAQVAILREEMSVLQLYLCQKANGGLPTDN